MVILVTGKNGQVGQALQHIAAKFDQITFYFTDSSDGDITSKSKLEAIFSRYQPDYCINTAAYTAVDKAESEPDKAFSVNVTGAKNIADVCSEFNTTLVHISTDFVFDGKKGRPYIESDEVNPLGVYGSTKLAGEIEIQKSVEKHYIIRTSWVYSQFGNNFMKTMLRLAKERDVIKVVDDQLGSPTNAVDLAEAIISIILNQNSKQNYGVYHYSSEGECSWYEFARQIFDINNISIDLQPISTADFPTPASRPKYSVLNKSKIKKEFGLSIPYWTDSIPAAN